MDIAVRGLSALLMIILPIGVGWWWARKWGTRWGLFFAGGVTFIASQVGHLPFNILVLNPLLTRMGLDPIGDIVSRYWAGIIFGLSAGIFEEIARYIVYRWWMKDVRQWREGVFFGLGHGGVEAIITGAWVAWALYTALTYQSADLSELTPQQIEVVTAQLNEYWSYPWHIFVLPVLERVFALMIHISLALMVMQVFTRRNALWLIVAIAWHALVDAVAVYGIYTWGAYWTEAAIGLLAAASAAIAWWLRPNVPSDTDSPDQAPQTPSTSSLEKAPDKAVDLDQSRYT